MKKRNPFILFALLIAIVLTSCTTTSTDSSIITIEMSEKAKDYAKNILPLFEDKAYMQEGVIEMAIAAYENRTEQLLPECDVNNPLSCQVFNDCNVYTLTPDNYEDIVLYIHGGAWVFEISSAHVTFCDDLATRLNAKVYMPLYPLAPESNAEETYAFLEALYKEIIKEGKKVYVMGDSAGGELTLGLMYAIKAEGLTKPEKLVVMAPCSDMSFTNPEIPEVDKIDPELATYGCLKCAEVWAGKENLKNPKYSAVYADVKGYPDTLIVQGTYDILCPDNLILFKNMKKAGVNATLLKGEGLWHVFGVYSIPERETVLNCIETFCSK